jgi:Domain of Unknown Function (DUF349)
MSEQQDPDDFGRVGDDGTVYVRTAAGERVVGQWPEGDPAAALAFYRKRYDGLALEVDLLEQRIRAGSLSPEDAKQTVAKVRALVNEAQAVGDLDALVARLDALAPVIGERREARRAERAAKSAEAKQAKEQIAEEAEQIARGNDWRAGANRLRDLLTRWKALPRIDKASDDELWHRFSSARTTYTRRRKQHFAELNVQRDAAREVKEKLVLEAEALADSTDWAGTARAYRDLMQQWKAAGPAPKEVDDALWKRFRAAQDSFFGARDETNAKLDQEYSANAEVKRAILAEAEALLPVSDVRASREAFRGLAERWEQAGKVPRSDMKELENRFRKVEQAVRGAEDEQWRRTNPEALARAQDTVSQLEASLAALEADLEKARQSGDERKVRQVESDIAARQLWLEGARSALTEFSTD